MTYSEALAGRVSLPHQAYHVTICTHHRQPFFYDWRSGRLVVQELKYMQQQMHVQSLAWVLMPDHLHWLMQLDETTFLTRALHTFKGRSAKAVNQFLGRKGSLWQRGFHDHAIRGDEDLRQTARYIVANPLRAQLVKHVADYPLWDAIWL
ncbi:transposase [Zobellella denitrificans]|jgi:REP element-mobilizing transposase RayT|uniref:REP-associated tyrosine transposase n=1 Tax=Zobellella denitrificans TaxID=347534 RepID=UPI000B8C56CB|nr:transposase [Zobellella denitrificans]OXS16926.1 transposase [Zobellella denitrificans]